MTIDRRLRQSHALVFSLVIISLFIPAGIEAQQKKYDQSLLKGLQWRSVGPFRGGRSTADAEPAAVAPTSHTLRWRLPLNEATSSSR